jgi:two-component system, sensor histidine kinase and response regulator
MSSRVVPRILLLMSRISHARAHTIISYLSDVSGVSAILWRWYGVFGLLATVGYFLLHSPAAQNIWYNLFSLSVPVATLVGVRVHRPAHRMPWLLIALGVFLSFVGDTAWTVYENVLHVEVPFPSFADAFYIGGYTVLVVALHVMIRWRKGAEAFDSFLNALIVIIGVGTTVWVFLMEPYARDTSLPWLDRFVLIASPLLDVLIVGALARLWFDDGNRSRAFVWLSLGFCSTLIADFAYMAMALAGTYETGHPVDAGWLLQGCLMGMAALHPSMRALTASTDEQRPRFTWWQLLALILAALLTPATMGLQFWRGVPIDIPLVVAASVVLFVLVMVRMGGLLHQLTTALCDYEQAEQGKRESEERFRSVFEHSPDGILLVDPHDSSVPFPIVECNNAVCRAYGYTRDELLGQSLHLLVTPRVNPSERPQWIERLRREGSWNNETAYRRKDGTLVPTEVIVSLVTVGGRELIMGVARDISERKRAEVELVTAHNAALQASRAKSEFLATMSHEIRTPMNGVIGMSELLLDTPLTSEQREYASIVRSSGHTLLTLIDDILDFSKVEAGKLVLETVEFCPQALTENVVDVVLAKAREKGIKLLAYIAPEIPARLMGDEHRLRQVLLNLLSNAVKFTAEGEVLLRVTVESETPSHMTLRCAVYDTGIGLSERTRMHLFEPFTQADSSTTRKYGGTGLGLAISKRLVELMGGSIGVQSIEGQGSKFWFTVALERAQDDAQPLSPTFLNQRVLIVDAHAMSRAITRSYIESWGMVCDVAASGAEGLRCLERESYAVVLVDDELRDMPVATFKQHVRHDARARTAVVQMRHLDVSRDNSSSKLDDAVYVAKPIKQSALFNVLQTTLHASAATEEPSAPAAPSGDDSTSSPIKDGVILLAEDNAVNQKLALLQLRKLGYQADAVSNGREAVVAVAQKRYALVLMDCQMPEMDGFAATAVIRQREHGTDAHLPIVALTANAMSGDREACLAAGMDDYLSKPVQIGALRTMLAHWLTPPETAS